MSGAWRLEVDGGTFDLTGGRTFADVPVGGLVLYLGSGGQIEIAVRDGSAAEVTGAGRGARLRLRRLS